MLPWPTVIISSSKITLTWVSSIFVVESFHSTFKTANLFLLDLVRNVIEVRLRPELHKMFASMKEVTLLLSTTTSGNAETAVLNGLQHTSSATPALCKILHAVSFALTVLNRWIIVYILAWLAFFGAQEQLLLWLIDVLEDLSTTLLCNRGVLHPPLSELRPCVQYRLFLASLHSCVVCK